ncbi:malonate decarboxylase subunit epsilon [Priestia megaterium]
MSVAFLFPGQGAQYAGMLHDIKNKWGLATTFEEASEALNQDVLSLDSSEKLKYNKNVQICLFIAGVATARSFKNKGYSPDVVGGHSIGAFGAAVASEVLSFKEALLLVKKRGELMENAYPDGYGMGVVMGLREHQLLSIVHELATDAAPVYVANLNAPDQMTISGTLKAIEKVLEKASKKGARKTKMLHVTVPSHCPLMEGVSSELRKTITEVKGKDPIVPFIGNCKARKLWKAADVKEDLAASVALPVRWHDTTEVMYEMGTRLYIEMAPGRVLTDLAAKSFPEARAISAAESTMKTLLILMEKEKI